MSRWLNSEVFAKLLEEMSDKDGQHIDEDLVILKEHGMDIYCVFKLMIIMRTRYYIVIPS
jgi:hypothetical protein